ncbi:MAG: acyl-CoA thioesterase [Rhodospirillaceae bacterium]|nr:MAG: acyl-CoA thioesterase [Rhodospirillaceae bacterium]
MARLDRTRLDKGIFPFRCEIATRIADLDTYGHINNVVIAGIFQEGRYRLFRTLDLTDNQDVQQVVAGLTIEFAGEMILPDPIQVATGVLDIGRTSFRLGQIATQNGRVGAYAEIVHVMRDQNGQVPIPHEMRAKLGALKIGDSL